jgi:hypothetical protein
VGLFGRDRIKDPVAGEAKVLELAPTRKGARQSGRLDVEFRLRLAVTAPGHGTYEVERTDAVPHAKVPLLGDRLPVTVSGSDPQRLRIDWDAAPDLATRARASAAAAQRGDAAGAAEALGFELREPDG